MDTVLIQLDPLFKNNFITPTSQIHNRRLCLLNGIFKIKLWFGLRMTNFIQLLKEVVVKWKRTLLPLLVSNFFYICQNERALKWLFNLLNLYVFVHEEIFILWASTAIAYLNWGIVLFSNDRAI